MTREVRPYGEAAVLLSCADFEDTQAVRAALTAEPWPEVEEVVVGAETLLLRLRSALNSRRRRELEHLSPPPVDPTASDAITIEVDYTGEDLAEVAERLDMSADDVIAQHTEQVWTVAFCGFAPGFAYLHSATDRLTVPRRDTPRKTVPAGAVGLADRWSGIYPRSGPGGWQLIGTTAETLWDLKRDPPALLQPGATVRFIPSTSSGHDT